MIGLDVIIECMANWSISNSWFRLPR